MARFSVYLGQQHIEDHFFEQGPVLVGRASEAQIRLEHSTVSRRHARLDRRGRDWVVRNLGGRNGLFVNGAYTEEHVLKDADCVDIGKYTLTFSPVDSAPAHLPRLVATSTSAGQSLEDALARIQDAPHPRFSEALDVVTGPIAVSPTARARARQAIASAGRGGEPKGAAVPVSPDEPHLAWTAAGGEDVLTRVGEGETLIGTEPTHAVRIREAPPGVTVCAAIRRVGDGYVVEPRSRHVTVKLRGARVTGATKLHDGAVLEVGSATIVFNNARDRR